MRSCASLIALVTVVGLAGGTFVSPVHAGEPGDAKAAPAAKPAAETSPADKTAEPAEPAERDEPAEPAERDEPAEPETTPQPTAEAPKAPDVGYALYVAPKKPADQDAATLLQGLLRKQLAGFEGVALVVHQGPPAATPAALLAPIEAGYRALNDAVTVKENTEKPKPGAPALAEFAKAQTALDELVAAKAVIPRRHVARLYKGIAIAHVLDKDGPKAQPFINDAINLWSEQTQREWGWGIAPANLFSFVKKRRDDNVEVGKIAVTGLAGARVIVDGKTAGQVPTTVERLRPGKHIVEVRADGHAPMSVLVTVVKDETAKVDAALPALANKARVDELVGLVAKQRRAPKAAPQLQELATAVSAKRVIVLAVSQRKSTWTLTGFVGGGGNPAPLKATFGRDAQMMTNITGLLSQATGAKPRAGGDTAAQEQPLDGPPKASLLVGAKVDPKKGDGGKKVGDGVEETEFYETWWFWTAVGGGVVVIATAVALAVVLTQEDDEPKFGDVNIQLNNF